MRKLILAILVCVLSSLVISCGGGGETATGNNPVSVTPPPAPPPPPPPPPPQLFSISEEQETYPSFAVIQIELDSSIDGAMVDTITYDTADFTFSVYWDGTNQFTMLIPMSDDGEHTLLFMVNGDQHSLTLEVSNSALPAEPLTYVTNSITQIIDALQNLINRNAGNPDTQASLESVKQDISVNLAAVAGLSDSDLLALGYFIQANIDLADAQTSAKATMLITAKIGDVDVLACGNLAIEVVSTSLKFSKTVKVLALASIVVGPELGVFVGGYALAKVLETASETIDAHGKLVDECIGKVIDTMIREVGSINKSFSITQELKANSAAALQFEEGVSNSYSIISQFAFIEEVADDISAARNNMVDSLNDSVLAAVIPASWIEAFSNFGLEFTTSSSAATYGVTNISVATIRLCASSYAQQMTIAFCFDDAARPADGQPFTFGLTDSRYPNVVTVIDAMLSAQPVPIAYDSLETGEQGTVLSGQLRADLADSFSLVSGGSFGSVSLTDAATGAFTYSPFNFGVIDDSFIFTASNQYGTSNAATITISILEDTEAPVVQITSPENNEIVSGTISLDVTATDNVAVHGVEFWVDGVLLDSDLTEPFGISLDTLTLSIGTHTLDVQAIDPAGNVAFHSVVFEVANNTPPTAVFTIAPPTGGVETTFVVDASLSTDQEDALQNLQFRWNWTDTAFPVWDGIPFSASPVSSHTYTEAGTYRVWLQVKDTEDFTAIISDLITVIVTPEITVSIEGVEISSSPDIVAHDIGPFLVRSLPTVDIDIQNTGTGVLSINSLEGNISEITGGAVGPLGTRVLNPGEIMTLTSTFAWSPELGTDILGIQTNNILIGSNDDDEPLFYIRLQGESFPPPPPTVTLGVPTCQTSSAAVASVEWKIESEASGSKNISAQNTGQTIDGPWLKEDSRSYSGTVVDCWQHMFESSTGGQLLFNATDEFGQVTETLIGLPTCVAGDVYPPFAWNLCAEYYAN